MKRFLLMLVLATQLGVAFGQEVRGPFTIPIGSYNFNRINIAFVVEDTVEFVAGNSRGVGHWSYSQSADTFVTYPHYLLETAYPWSTTLYDPATFVDGWAALAYEQLVESEFDYGYNRLHLIQSHNGAITSTVIDSGRTHRFWVDSLSRRTLDASIIARQDGGFYTRRQMLNAVWNNAGGWQLVHENEVREYTTGDATPIFRDIPCYGDLYSGRADSLLIADFNNTDDHSVSACIGTRNASLAIPPWDDCVIQNYSVMFTWNYGILLLTGYSPVLQLRQLTFDGNCELLSEVNAVAQNVATHPDYGYSLITQGSPGRFGQMSLQGELVREPAPFTQSLGLVIDKHIADNGDTYVLTGSTFEMQFFAIPWNAVLDTRDATPEIPQEVSLSAYPNPFNSSVTISFELPRSGDVELNIFDLNGRLVETLRDDFSTAGTHTVNWAPGDLASGVYFATLETSFAHTTQKILYLK